MHLLLSITYIHSTLIFHFVAVLLLLKTETPSSPSSFSLPSSSAVLLLLLHIFHGFLVLFDHYRQRHRPQVFYLPSHPGLEREGREQM